jgi:hypothetical protein
MSPRQKASAASFMLGGAVLSFLSQQAQQDLPLDLRLSASILLGIGILFFAIGIWFTRKEESPRRLLTALDKIADWFSIQPWQVSFLFVSIPLVILVHFAAGDSERMPSPFPAWTAWIIAASFMILAGWRFGAFSLRGHSRLFVIALVFAILAFTLRGIATGQIPILLNGDEASAGIYGARILDGSVNNPFITGWYSFPSLYFWIPAIGIKLFGQTTEALRIPSAVVGALTVGALYLAGQAIFNKRVGLIAAILLLGFHQHIHFSRIGLNNIWDGFFYVLTVGTVWYGWSRENRNALLLAGLSMGLAQYFYPSSRTIIVLVYGWLFVSAFLDWKKFKRLFPGLLLMTLAMGIVLLPLAWFYINHPEEFMAPLQRVSILGSWMTNEIAITGKTEKEILLNQIWLGIQSFTYLPLQHWYRPEVPFLRPVSATLFLLGLIFLLFRFRESRTYLLVFWIIMFILLGGLSESTPASQRYVAAAPVCIMLAAFALDEMAALAESFWPKSGRWANVIALAIVVFASASDINFYFNTYTPKSVTDLDASNGMVAQQLANYLKDKPVGTQVIFFGQPLMGYYSIPSTQYLAPQATGLDITDWSAPNHPMPTSQNLVFVFLPINANQIPSVLKDYPGGPVLGQKSPTGQTLYYYYTYSGNPK